MMLLNRVMDENNCQRITKDAMCDEALWERIMIWTRTDIICHAMGDDAAVCRSLDCAILAYVNESESKARF